ncbi:hypothetical protein ACFL5Z_04745 [Planctomycetota bacterium]
MDKDIDLKQVQRDAYAIFRQDGLDTLCAGMALGMIALFFIDIRHAWVFALATTLAITMPELVRRQFVYPRIGYARFLRSKGIVKHVIAISAAVICLVLFYVMGKMARFNWLMPLFLGVVLSTAALVAGRRLGLTVYYVLAFAFLMSGLSGLGFTSSGYDSGWVVAFQLWALATIMIPVGVFQFVWFLQKYQKPRQEIPNGSD